MTVGVVTWELALPGCDSLKAKRMIVASLKGRIRHRFNVSVSETGLHDVTARARLSVAVVTVGRAHADSTLDKVDRFIERDGRALLVGVHRELY